MNSSFVLTDKRRRKRKKYGDQMSVSVGLTLDQTIRSAWSAMGYRSQGELLRKLVEIGAEQMHLGHTGEA